MDCTGPKDPQQRQTATDAEFAEADIGNGQRFARRYGDDIHYCWNWKQWIIWDGTRWKIDDKPAAFQKAKETVMRLFSQAAEISNDRRREELVKHATDSAKAPRVKAMMEMAQSEDGIPVKHDELDVNDWLLNCPNGTLNLKTGNLQWHDRADMITKLCPTEYHADAECPLWLKFQDRIFDGNQHLIDFVQRLLGYSLTGDVSEHVLPIFWGSGANGKSTLIETIFTMMGDEYSLKLPHSMLMQSNGERHPTEIADLFGQRFTSACETEFGKLLSEVLVKELTGGDRLAARRMREDFWRFLPTHKIFIATNHKPGIRSTDNAIWRRIRLVPFSVTIADAEQDRQLLNKLKRELPGILAWCVRGCLEWQQNGLGMPTEVEAATSGYRNSEDVVGSFISECCVKKDHYKVKAAKLHDAYLKWAERTGEQKLKQRNFGQAMTERNFERYKNNGIGYVGIELITEPSE